MEKKRRERRPRKALRVIGSVSAIFLLLVLLPFLSVRLPAVREWLLDRSLHNGILQEDWSLRIDSVPRFDPWGVRMEGLRLLRRMPEGQEEWARIGRFELRWNPIDLMRRRIWADQIRVDSLVVRIDRPAPTIGPGAQTDMDGSEGRKNLPWLRFDALRFGVELRDAQGPVASGRVFLEEVEHRDGRVECLLRHLIGQYHPDTLSIELTRGRIVGSLDTQVVLKEAHLSSDGIEADLECTVVVPSRVNRSIGLATAITIESLEPARIGLVRGLRIPFAQNDSLSGDARVEIESSVVSLRVNLTGRLLGGSLEKLNLLMSAKGDTVDLLDFGCEHRLGFVSGEGRFLRGRREGQMQVRFDRFNLSDRSLEPWFGRLPTSDLTGRIEGRGRFDGDRSWLHVAGRFEDADLLGLRAGPLVFSGGVRNRLVVADSIVSGRPGEGWSVRGEWETDRGALDLFANLDGVRLEDWLTPLSGVPSGGSFSGRLRVTGTLDRPQVQGDLRGHDFRLAGLSADTLSIDRLDGPLLPPRFDGRIRARNVGVYGTTADSARLRVEWGDRLSVDAHAFSGSLSVSVQAAVTPANPGSVRVDRLEIAPGRRALWRTDRPFRIAWSREATRFEGLSLVSEDGTVSGRLTLGADDGVVDGRVHLERINLATIGRLMAFPDSSLVGRADLDLWAAGRNRRPRLTAQVTGESLVVARWPIDRLHANLLLAEEGVLSIDSLEVGGVRGAGTFTADKIVVRPGRPLPAFLAGLSDSLESYLRDTELEGSCRLWDLSMSRVFRAAMEASPDGRSGLFAQPVDPMTARIRNVRAGKLGMLIGIRERISGNAEIDLRFSGSAARPHASILGKVYQLQLYHAVADSVRFGVSLTPGSAVLDSLLWHRGGNASRAWGRLPMAVSLLPGGTHLLPHDSLAFEAELPDIDLGILGVLNREITDPVGFLSGAVSLRGTPMHFWPEGSLTIRDGGVRIPKREERLHSINGTVFLDSSGVRIESLRGAIGPKGKLELRGTFRNLDEFDLEGEVVKATAYETGLYHFTFDGDFRAFPVESTDGGYPLVVGTVDVLEGAIVGDLAKAPPSPEKPGHESSPWRAEIDIYAPGNIRMQTTVASVELGEAENLHVSFDDPEINVSGGIKVLGGRYRVFNNIFTITSGRVEFRDTGRGTVEPILDVHAETQVSLSAETTELETVTIHATGPVTQLSLEFESSGGLAIDEIVTLLSVGRLRDETGSIGVADPSRQFLFTEVVSQIESEITQSIRPLQNVTVRPGDEPGGAWQLNVRQTVLPQVSLAYSRELTSAAGQEVSVHYNLSGRLYLNAAVERRLEEGAYADRYSLDLKMRFEYK